MCLSFLSEWIFTEKVFPPGLSFLYPRNRDGSLALMFWGPLLPCWDWSLKSLEKISSLLLWLCWFLTFIWVFICLALGLVTCLECETIYTGMMWPDNSLHGSSDPSCGAGRGFVTILTQSWCSHPWVSHEIVVWAILFLETELIWGSAHCPVGHDTKQGSGPCACPKTQNSPSPTTRLMSLCHNQLRSLKLCCFSWRLVLAAPEPLCCDTDPDLKLMRQELCVSPNLSWICQGLVLPGLLWCCSLVGLTWDFFLALNLGYTSLLKTLHRPGKAFQSQSFIWSKGASLCVHPHSLSEDRKPREVCYVVFGTHNILNFACCCHRAVAGLLMGRFFLPTFSCWQAGLLSPAPFMQRQRNQPLIHPCLGEVKALVTAGKKSLGSQIQTGMTSQRWAWSFLSP